MMYKICKPKQFIVYYCQYSKQGTTHMLRNTKLAFLLPLLAFLLLTGCDSPSLLGKKVEKKYYTGGALLSEFIWSDSTGRNGTLKHYGFEGHQISTVNITNGVKHGIETKFDSKGRVIQQTPYNNGRINGIDKAFYPNGDRMLTFTYRNGIKDGYAYSYYPDGKVCKKAVYRRGRLSN